MAIAVIDSQNSSYDGNLTTASGAYRAEAQNLSTAGSSLSLGTTRTLPVTFSNAGTLKGVMFAFVYGRSCDRSVVIDLQKFVGAVWVSQETKTLTPTDIQVRATDSASSLNPDAIFRSAKEWTTAVTTGANTWRFVISQTGGTTGNASVITSSGSTEANIMHCAWCDTKITPTSNDVLIVTDPCNINASFTILGAVENNISDNTRATAGIIEANRTTLDPASICYLTCLSPAAPYTFTVNGLLFIGAYAGMRVGTSTSPISYANQFSLVFTNTPSSGATGSGLYVKGSGVPTYATNNLFFYGQRDEYAVVTYSEDAIVGNTYFKTTNTNVANWVANDTIMLGGQATTSFNGLDTQLVYTVSSVTLAAGVYTVNLTTPILLHNRTAGEIAIRTNYKGISFRGASSANNSSSGGGVVRIAATNNIVFDGVEFKWLSQGTNFYIGNATYYEIDKNITLPWSIAHCSFVPSAVPAYQSSLMTFCPMGIKGFLIEHCASTASPFVNMIAIINSTKYEGTVDHLYHIAVNPTSSMLTLNITSNIHYTNCYFSNGLQVFTISGGNNSWLGNKMFGGLGLKVEFSGAKGTRVGENIYTNLSTFHDFPGSADIVDEGSTFTNVSYAVRADRTQPIFFEFKNPIGTLNLWRPSNLTMVLGSEIRLTNYNATPDNIISYYKLGNTTSVIADGVGTQLKANPEPNEIFDLSWIASTGAVTGHDIYIAVNCTIQNAAYYAGTYEAPYLQITYDGGTLNTAAAATNSTNLQLLEGFFTPTQDKAIIEAHLVMQSDAGLINGSVVWDSFVGNLRTYGYTFVDFSYTLFQSSKYPIFDIPTPVVNAFITEANVATVAAYTQATIDHNAQTVDITAAMAVSALADYSQYNLTLATNRKYPVWLSTFEGATFNMDAAWVLTGSENFTWDKRLAGGTIAYAATGVKSPTVGAITFSFGAVGTYDLREADITGTITLINTSGGAVVVQVPNGTTYINTGPNITVEEQPLVRGLSFATPIVGATVVIFDTGTQTIVDTITAAPWEWSEEASGTRTLDYTVLQDGYVPIRVTGVEVTGSVFGGILSQPITQIPSRAYQSPSGLTFGTTATVDTGTKRFTLTVPSTGQNWYSFMMQSWRTQAALRNIAFPLSENGPNSFTLADGWEFDGAGSIANLSRDGMRYTNSGTVTAIWVAIFSLADLTGLQARYQLTAGSGTQDTPATGAVDGLFQVYGDATHGNFDYRGHLTFKVQAQGYDEAKEDVVATYGTLEDQFYVINLAPTPNNVATGDPAITGVSITNHGASPVTWNSKTFSITLQDTGSNTGTNILRWLRYNFSQGGTFQGTDAFNWHDLIQTNGAKFKTVRGIVEGSVGASLKGVRVVLTDGTTHHPDFDLFTADDGTTYSPPPSITVENMNLVSGSRVQLYNITQDIELENMVLSGAGYSYTTLFGTGEDVEAGDILRLRATYANGATYKENYQELGVASGYSLTFIGEQTDWANANALGISGAVQTEYSADYPNIQVDVSASGNVFKVGELVAWVLYTQTSVDGIRNFYGCLSSTNPADWLINVAQVNMYLDNVNAATANQEDAVVLSRSDGVYPQVIPTSGGGGIGMYQNLIVTAQGGVPATAEECGAATWEHTAATGAGTKGKLLADAKIAAQNAFVVSA